MLTLVVLALVVACGVVIYALSRDPGHPGSAPVGARDVWTCPMHPEVREHAPGKCATCGMDLVKETAAGPAPAGIERAEVQLDTRRRQLLGVRTATVERVSLDRPIRAVGLVRFDETRLTDVNLKLDGWVKKLHVDYTGQPVRRGQPLLDLYSPDLLATEQELLLALSTRDAMQSSQVPDARVQADRLVESARQRLLLWDLPGEVVQELERTRRADPHVTFRSPVNGFVIEKPVVEGMRVTAGQTLYRVADLGRVWVEAEVHESDAPLVKTGAPATVTLDAWPGESLRGRAVYIYPFVEEKTRTLKVRLSFANPRLRLKPGMFANVELASGSGTGLAIPADALVDAGRQQLVFVANGGGSYEPRAVVAGQRLGDRVQILSGLEEGQEVAAGAAFFLDSESQLRAATGAWEAQAPESTPASTGQVSLTFSPGAAPRAGENVFEARVADPAGQPIADAQVRVVLHMPAMPSMNMPAMTSEATLAHQAGGVYRGRAIVSMAGRWDVTLTAARDGRRLGVKQTTLVVR
jgi:RND family efflux transporter MFP subunit